VKIRAGIIFSPVRNQTKDADFSVLYRVEEYASRIFRSGKCDIHCGTFYASKFLLGINSMRMTGIAMNHHQLEKDIEHLEHVISHISAEDRIPLSYWRNRIELVSDAVKVPAHASRVKRLNAALSALENRQKA
jgi:hypothetical protein